MQYFKHAELAKEYHVSLKTVYNWIEAAKQSKIDLELIEQDGRTYIANKQSNVVVLRQLAQEGKKYRNARFQKIVTPKPEFYELFNKRQILDIITQLSVHGEIPRQYNYFNGGASSWDERMRRDVKDPGLGNMLKGTQELLHTNMEAVGHLIEGYDRVNVVDVGPGNAMPIRELLEHLLERGVLHRYIAIDISEAMLNLARHNIESWFGDRVPFEGHLRDITHERFNDILVDDMLDERADQTINLMLFLGGTPTNFSKFSDPVKTIYGSMGASDLLVYTDKPDTEASRRYFESNPTPASAKLAPGYRLIPELLNITEDLYDPEMGFDEHKRMRYLRIRLNTAITISFRFKHGKRNVNLEKGSTVLLLRVWHKSALELIDEFQETGLALLQSSMTKDRHYLLTIFGMEEAETSL